MLNLLMLPFCLLICADFSLSDDSFDRTMTIGAYVGNSTEVKIYEEKGSMRLMYESAFENMGYKLTVINQPYLRNLQLANAGKIDGTVIYKLDGNVDLYGVKPYLSVSTVPHMATDLVLYAKKGHAEDIMQDIKSVSVGIMRVFPNTEAHLNDLGIEPHFFKDYTSLFQVLEAGRVDVILVPSIIYNIFLHSNYIQNDYEYVKSIGCLEGSMAFSVEKFGRKKADALAQEHGEAISKLREMKSDNFYFDC